MTSFTLAVLRLPAAVRRTKPGSWSALHAIRRVGAWIARERECRRGIAELSTLDDRMLADIGLSRGEIDFAVRYGHPLPARRLDPCR